MAWNTHAAGASATETLMLGDGVGNLGKIEDLMTILGISIQDNLSATNTTGIREVTRDMIDVGFRNDLSGIPDMTGLGAALSFGGLAVIVLLGLAGESRRDDLGSAALRNWWNWPAVVQRSRAVPEPGSTGW
jgi:hypothetical protein